MAKYCDGLDQVALALAVPARRQILARLATGPASSSELAELVGIGLPTIAKHVVILADARLITSEKSGRVVTHRLCRNGFDELQRWITERTELWNTQFDALHHHLTQPRSTP